jgi:hypothetical protein
MLMRWKLAPPRTEKTPFREELVCVRKLKAHDSLHEITRERKTGRKGNRTDRAQGQTKSDKRKK